MSRVLLGRYVVPFDRVKLCKAFVVLARSTPGWYDVVGTCRHDA